MKTNSNIYTIIYSIILVIVVAGILAFVSSTLKPKQQENADLAKMKTILLAANLGEDLSNVSDKTAYIKNLYGQHVTDSYVLNAKGEKIEGDAFTIDLKSQYDIMKQITDAKDENKAESYKNKLTLPVFVCTLDNGTVVNIFPCYGAGLWGAIWGYLSVESDFETIYGAIFDHKSETPGLGAEIASPWFYHQFRGKKLTKEGVFSSVRIVKGGGQANNPNGVDAVSGGTITSRSLQNTIESWLEDYQPFFNIQKELLMKVAAADSVVAMSDTLQVKIEKDE